jgi:hypothetical protein
MLSVLASNVLFSPWYSWKFFQLALNNDQSLTHLLKQNSTVIFFCKENWIQTFQDEPIQSTCKTCPAGFYCNATFGPVINYATYVCPEGFFCPDGTRYPEEFYSNKTQQSSFFAKKTEYKPVLLLNVPFGQGNSSGYLVPSGQKNPSGQT